jgi:hypothetical protein
LPSHAMVSSVASSTALSDVSSDMAVPDNE